MQSKPRKIPFFDHCRIERPVRENGRCVARVEIAPDLTNSLEMAHGGLIMTLLDACMAGAASSSVDPGYVSITIDMQINFLSPGRGVLTAEGKVLRGGKSLIVVEGWVRDAQDGLVAKGTGLFRPVKSAASKDSP